MKLKKTNKKRMKFFSLMEVIIAITIVALVAAIAIGKLTTQTDGALIKVTQTELSALSGDITRFKLNTGKLPQDLNDLVQNSRNLQGWIKIRDVVPVDSWKNPIKYEQSSTNTKGYILTSLGSDGQEGGEDANADITFPARTQ